MSASARMPGHDSPAADATTAAPRARSDALVARAAASPRALAAADGGTRARAVQALQRTHGNASVQRLARELRASAPRAVLSRCAGCGGTHAGPAEEECEECRAARLG